MSCHVRSWRPRTDRTRRRRACMLLPVCITIGVHLFPWLLADDGGRPPTTTSPTYIDTPLQSKPWTQSPGIILSRASLSPRGAFQTSRFPLLVHPAILEAGNKPPYRLSARTGRRNNGNKSIRGGQGARPLQRRVGRRGVDKGRSTVHCAQPAFFLGFPPPNHFSVFRCFFFFFFFCANCLVDVAFPITHHGYLCLNSSLIPQCPLSSVCVNHHTTPPPHP